MINYKRVKRIKRAIYIFLLMLILVPVVFFLVLSIKILRIMPQLNRIIAENQPIHMQVQGQAAQEQNPSEYDLSLSHDEPAKRPVPQGTSKGQSEKKSEPVQSETPAYETSGTSRGQPGLTDLPALDDKYSLETLESPPEQEVTDLPLNEENLSPNTGLPKQ